jgi:hypothetical protein
MAHGMDLRPLPLRDRKAHLARIGKGAKGWLALTNGVVCDGRALSGVRFCRRGSSLQAVR